MTEALGFTRGTTPCASTIHDVFKGLTSGACEERREGWAGNGVRTVEGRRVRGRARDGKTLRGSKKQGAPGTHLLSLVSPGLGLTLVQQAVEDKTTKIPASLAVLRRLLFTAEVITVEALLTQREIATTIVERGGAYLRPAKDNQPELRAMNTAVLATRPPWPNRCAMRWSGPLDLDALNGGLSRSVRCSPLTRTGRMRRRSSGSTGGWCASQRGRSATSPVLA